MSVEAVAWALSRPLGGNLKVVLIGLANHARPDGTNAWPSIGTLATYAHCSERTVQRCLRELEADMWIIPTGKHGRADRATAVWRLPLQRDAKMSCRDGDGVTPVAGGVTSTVERGDTAMSPEPSLEPSKEPSFETDGSWNEESEARSEALDLFFYWQDRCDKPDTRPTSDRLDAVKARLAEGYTREQIREGIDGAARAAFVKDGQRYDDLELICRSGSKLDSFRKRAGTRKDKPDWLSFAKTHFPDWPPEMVSMSAGALSSGGHEVTPELVRARFLAAHPDFREDQAA